MAVLCIGYGFFFKYHPAFLKYNSPPLYTANALSLRELVDGRFFKIALFCYILHNAVQSIHE